MAFLRIQVLLTLASLSFAICPGVVKPLVEKREVASGQLSVANTTGY
ncbi:MAG TPA: hypothetical protein VKE98_16835 [Gemmataceae bacterium]|nr:hypothetical protein [Gemmataceae bacterium]